MSTTEKRIRIVIDSSAAQAGAASVNQALASIGNNNALSGLNSAVTGAGQSMVRTGSAAQQMASALSAANSNAASASGVFSSLGQSMLGVASGANSLGGALSGLATTSLGVAAGLAAIAASLAAIGSKAVGSAMEVQTYKANLTTVLGDAGKASEQFNALLDFAAKTPFSLGQAVEGFIKLKALGLTPSKEALTSYGNTAAAMGKNLNQMIEAVADASTGQFERLLEFGIKSKSEGDKVAFTFGGVTKVVGKNSHDIQQYLMDLGNTKFGDAMKNQNQTLVGSFSNLSDNIFKAFAALGEGMVKPVTSFVNLLADGLEAVSPLLNSIGNVVGSIGNVLFSITGAVANFFKMMIGGGENTLSTIQILTFAFNAVGQTVNVVAELMAAAFRGLAYPMRWVVGQIDGLWGWVMNKLGITTSDGTQSIGNKFIGILRAVKFVALNIPELFKSAINAVGSVFGILGDRIKAFFAGNWNAFDGMGKAMAGQFAGVGKAIDTVTTKAGKLIRDVKGNEAALGRMLGGDTSRWDDSTDKKPKTGTSGGKSKGGSDKESPAEKYADFLQKMRDEVTLAGMLPLKAQEYTKELEAQKILGRALTDAERQLIDSLVQAKTLAAAITSIKEDTRKAENERLANSLAIVGATEQEQKVQDALTARRRKALDDGLSLSDITSDVWKTEEQRLATILRQNIAYDEQQKKMADLQKKGADLIAQAGQQLNPRAALQKTYDDNVAAIMAAKPGANETPQQFDARQRAALKWQADILTKGYADIQMKRTQDIVDGLSEMGNAIGGKFGDALNTIGAALNNLAKGLSGQGSGLIGGLAKTLGLTGEGTPFAEGFKSITDGLGKSFKDIFGDKFVKDLGKTLGKMNAGAEIGSAVAGIGKLINSNFSSTGSQIGGALGSFLGPVGSIVGSIAGGILGGLFTKIKRGAATVTSGGTSIIRSNDGGITEALNTTGKGLNGSISKIAEALGGSVGNYAVGIGNYKGKYYQVSWNANDRGLGGAEYYKKGSAVAYDGTDAEQAMRVAILAAIKQGAIKGIREGTQRLLKASDDTDAQLTKALKFEGVFKTLKSIQDPIGAAVDSLNSELKGLADIFKEAGATADEWASLNSLRAEKVKAIFADQTSSLNDFLKTLSGEGSGMTDLQRLTADLGKFAAMRSDIASGKVIDQNAFTNLGQEIFGLAGSVYGTSTSDFQNIRSMLMDATNGAITNVQSAINDSTVVAIQNQTQAVVTSVETTGGLTNDLLRQQNEYLAALAAKNGYSVPNAYAVNGTTYGAF